MRICGSLTRQELDMRVTDEPLIGPLHLRVIYVLRSASVTLVQRKKQKDKKRYRNTISQVGCRKWIEFLPVSPFYAVKYIPRDVYFELYLSLNFNGISDVIRSTNIV